MAVVRFSLLTSFSSKKLVGEDLITATEGTIVSNANMTYGLKMSYGLSPSWHFLLGHEIRNYAFDNTENIIAGEEAIDANTTEIGMRWIVFSRTALRFLFLMDDSVAFKVDANNKAVLYTENLKYFSIYYDQIVYLGTTIFAGFKIGTDLPTSGNDIIDRTGTKYGVFITLNTTGLGQFEGYFEMKESYKEDDNLSYTENDANLNITYTVGF